MRLEVGTQRLGDFPEQAGAEAGRRARGGASADAGRPGADAGRPGADAGGPGADAGGPGSEAGGSGSDTTARREQRGQPHGQRGLIRTEG